MNDRKLIEAQAAAREKLLGVRGKSEPKTDLSGLSRKQLFEAAKAAGITGYTTMKSAEIRDALEA